jgi:hypothetical protein
MLTIDFHYSTVFRLKATPPYNFLLTVQKPAGWPLLTPYETFEDGTLWTVMETTAGFKSNSESTRQAGSEELFGLKLRSPGTVGDPEILCELFSQKKLDQKKSADLSETIARFLEVQEYINQFYSLAERSIERERGGFRT